MWCALDVVSAVMYLGVDVYFPSPACMLRNMETKVCGRDILNYKSAVSGHSLGRSGDHHSGTLDESTTVFAMETS